MGNFEVSVALFVKDFQALFPNWDDVLQDCSKINNKASDDMFYFEETIIRKQFHSLVV
jgi:hypothetical protein